ncbi:hypothetical protein Leryth_012992 [Lithospermum erythrorhizon]|nr:hypothetical protein Leryth_012992 [Lithospermum erythrorhizon]
MVTLHRNHNSLCYHVLFVTFIFLSVTYVAHVADALGTFGYDIHHRYSDTVKKILGSDGLPEKDTVEYFTALVHRDHLRGRHLAGGASTQLTFASGNLTGRFSDLGLLQYVYTKVGTPGRDFLVALDSGSDLFWLPCECRDCPRSITLRSGTRLDFNIYQLNGSSTVTPVACSSSICGPSYSCLTEQNVCAYKTSYVPVNTSSAGILLQDVLQLGTNENPSTSVNATITLGCGVIQTGSFLSNTAVNGLLGLGMGNISVPSILASQSLTANSFSMCSGLDGLGRIVFGDKGSLDQSETPFGILQSNYIVSIEQVAIGSTVSALEFTALFDSGLAFTRLSDPVYTTLAESFDSQVVEPRRIISGFSFEYCYDLSSTSSGPAAPKSPSLAFTMNGGSQFNIRTPIIIVSLQNSGYAYCLGVIKSQLDIIGLNFMNGQKMIFDREKNVLGWKPSDCYGNDESNSTPPPPRTSNPPPPVTTSTPPPPRTSNPPPPVTTSTPPPPRTSTPPPPLQTSNPPPPQRIPFTPPPPGSTEASPGDSTTNSSSQAPGFRFPGTGDAAQLNSFTWKVGMAFLSFLSHYFIFH